MLNVLLIAAAIGFIIGVVVGAGGICLIASLAWTLPINESPTLTKS